MARAVTPARKITVTIAAWLVGLVIAFPIIWMVLTSFKTELEASSLPPKFLFFDWTMENYAIVQQRSDYFHHAVNSLIIAGGSVLLALIIAVPAAWAMAFAPTERTRGTLLWMLSTKMMPPVGVMVPIYLFFRDVGLLDTRIGLVGLLCLGNLPIVVWMLFTYFKEIPEGHSRGGAHGRRDDRQGAHLCSDADGGARHRLDAAPQFHPGAGTRRSGRWC